MAEIISGRYNAEVEKYFGGAQPYEDNQYGRTFDANASDEEYVWHRDHNDREVEIIEGEGWQLQIEDCLPMLLNDVKKVFIPKGVYHRLIKGYNTLRVKINENI